MVCMLLWGLWRLRVVAAHSQAPQFMLRTLAPGRVGYLPGTALCGWLPTIGTAHPPWQGPTRRKLGPRATLAPPLATKGTPKVMPRRPPSFSEPPFALKLAVTHCLVLILVPGLFMLFLSAEHARRLGFVCVALALKQPRRPAGTPCLSHSLYGLSYAAGLCPCYNPLGRVSL